MPRQIAEDDEKPRRRRRTAAVAVEAEPERGLIMRGARDREDWPGWWLRLGWV